MTYDEMIKNAMSYSGPLGKQYGFTQPEAPMSKLPEGATNSPPKDYGAMIDAMLKTVGAGMSKLMDSSFKGSLPFASAPSLGGASAVTPPNTQGIYPQRGGYNNILARFLARG